MITKLLKGDCSDVLFSPGAGKTTTFSMLTGDLSITEGTAFLGGYDILTNLREVCQLLRIYSDLLNGLSLLQFSEVLTNFFFHC